MRVTTYYNSHYRCKFWTLLCNLLELFKYRPLYCHNNFKLCSDHFEPSQINNKLLVRYAIPTIFNRSLLIGHRVLYKIWKKKYILNHMLLSVYICYGLCGIWIMLTTILKPV